MMEPEDQVCSLELAKRLKELGIKQDSFFYWWQRVDGCGSPRQPWKQREDYVLLNHFSQHPFQEIFSAFTVAELGKILTSTASYEAMLFFLPNYIKQNDDWLFTYNNGCIQYLQAKTEADARSKIIIHLFVNSMM